MPPAFTLGWDPDGLPWLSGALCVGAAGGGGGGAGAACCGAWAAVELQVTQAPATHVHNALTGHVQRAKTEALPSPHDGCAEKVKMRVVLDGESALECRTGAFQAQLWSHCQRHQNAKAEAERSCSMCGS